MSGETRSRESASRFFAVATIPLPYPRRLSLPEPPSPPLLQFLALSLLLHVLAVLVFGTPERLGVRDGGSWRDEPFAVTLRPSAAGRESPWRPSFGAERGGTGSALSQGAPAPSAPPRAPKVAAPVERAAAPERAPPAERAPEAPLPQEAPAPQEGPLPQEAPTPGTLPRLDLGAPEIVDKPIVPEVGIRPQEAPTPEVPRVELERPRSAPPPAIAAPPRPEPSLRPPVVERPAPTEPAPETTLKPTAPVEPPPEPLRRIEPEAPAELAPLLRVPEPEPVILPRPVAEPAPPAEAAKQAAPAAKRETPAEAAPAAAPEATPKIAPAEVAPAEVPRAAPAPVTATPTQRAPAPAEPIATPARPSVTPSEAPPTPAPVREAPPTPAPVRETPPTPAPVRETPPTPAPVREAPTIESEPYRVAPVPLPPPSREAPSPPARLNYGAPPDDDIFAPRASPSALDADAARKAARDTVRAESRRTGIVPLNLFPPPPEKESKLARDIQKAAQPDCRDAYAAMGLLAIPFLLKDTVTDTGCRW